MKKRIVSVFMMMTMAIAMIGCGNKTADNGKADDATAAESGEGAVYKVGIIQYVDDASLNQIVDNLEKQLDALAEEKGVTFDYKDYYYNGQADSTTINQIVTELINDEVDVLVPIATPTAMICQSATEENQIPVIFAAVSDPEGAGLVAKVLVENGIRAIWNFAHVDLDVPEYVQVENVHLSDSLMKLSYNISSYNENHKDQT